MTRGITPEQAKEIRKAKGIEDTKLQKIRLKKGYSQGKLSKASGISIRTIQNYEQRKIPIEGAHLQTLCNLATALNCKIEDFLENEEIIKKYKEVK